MATARADKLSAELMLTRAVSDLIMSKTGAFYGTLVMRLIRQVAEWQPTTATDGKHLFYNPAFIQSLTPEQVIAIVQHETLHCALGHFLRRGDRDPLRMNIGGDLAINPIIRDGGRVGTGAGVGGGVLPDGALFPAQFKFPENQSMEWYADRLPEDLRSGCGGKCGAGSGQPCSGDPNGSGPPCTEDHGGCSGVLPPPAESGSQGQGQAQGQASHAEAQRLAAEWQIATIQAAQAARSAGALPGALERLVDQIRKPQVDWKDVLRRFISVVTRNDYRMFPPSRRFAASGLYLPSMRSDSIGEVVCVVDASGSIGGAEFQAFASEVNGICDEVKPETLHVVYHDAKVTGHDEFSPEDYPVRFATEAGGGTNFDCVTAYLDKRSIRPVACIWFTDMYPDHWPKQPEYPVLWCATTDVKAPWGETVRIRVGEER